MNIVQLISILKDSDVCKFLYSYGASKLLDCSFNGLIRLYKKNKKETIETQLIQVLYESYENTCNNLKLECDIELITETFIYNIYKYDEPLSIDIIKQLLRKPFREIDNIIFLNYDIFKIWEYEFLYSLSKGYNILKDYLILKKIVDDEESISFFKETNLDILRRINDQNLLIQNLTNIISNVEYLDLYKIIESHFRNELDLLLKELI